MYACPPNWSDGSVRVFKGTFSPTVTAVKSHFRRTGRKLVLAGDRIKLSPIEPLVRTVTPFHFFFNID